MYLEAIRIKYRFAIYIFYGILWDGIFVRYLMLIYDKMKMIFDVKLDAFIFNRQKA